MPEELRFLSGAEECAATLYRPPGAPSDLAPCVVMANGVSMTRRDGIPRFAERFANAGIAALTFDFRHLGDSDGEPRQLIDFDRHLADFAAALALARTLDGIDARRVAAWGFSSGGGLALTTVIEDRSVAAAILLCPMVDGLAFFLAANARNNIRIAGTALRGLVERDQPAIPLTGPPGKTVLFTQAEAAPGFEAVRGEGSLWKNEMRFVPTQPMRFRPARKAGRVGCPLLVCAGLEDTMVPARPIERTAARAGAELRQYPINHFGAFLDGFDVVASDQVEFLASRLAQSS